MLELRGPAEGKAAPTVVPQELQKFAPSGKLAPHFAQNAMMRLPYQIFWILLRLNRSRQGETISRFIPRPSSLMLEALTYLIVEIRIPPARVERVLTTEEPGRFLIRYSIQGQRPPSYDRQDHFALSRHGEARGGRPHPGCGGGISSQGCRKPVESRDRAVPRYAVS